MTDKKFTDEEIIKRLERCVKRGNRNYDTDIVLDLINRQKAENLKLRLKVNELLAYKQEVTKNNIKNYEEYTAQKSKIENLQNVISNQQIEISAKIEKQIKSEAYKEFTEKLKEEIRLEDDCDYNCRECCYECNDYVIAIENLLKEMVGEEE